MEVKNDSAFNQEIAYLLPKIRTGKNKDNTKYKLDNSLSRNIENSKLLKGSNHSALQFIIQEYYHPGGRHRIKVFGYNNEDFTYSPYDYKKELDHNQPRILNKSQELSILFRLWNVIQFFYPFKEEVQDDWNVVLHEVIEKDMKVKNEFDFNLILMEFIAKMHDSHGYFSSYLVEYNFLGGYTLPIEGVFIDKKFCVTDIDLGFSNSTGIHVGDIITRYQGQSMDTLYFKYFKYVDGHNISFRENRLCKNILRTNSSKVNLQIVDSSGVFKNVSCKTMALDGINLAKTGRPKYYIIRNGVLYVDIEQVFKKDINKIFSMAENCHSIIFDYRGYPNETSDLIMKRIMLKKSKVLQYCIINPKYPGKFDTSYYTLRPYLLSKRYKGNIFLLIDNNTASQSENAVISLKSASEKVITVGSISAGATGSIAHTMLTTNLIVFFTLSRFSPCGKVPIVDSGIIPDKPVKLNIEDIRHNKDAILNAALEMAR